MRNTEVQTDRLYGLNLRHNDNISQQQPATATAHNIVNQAPTPNTTVMPLEGAAVSTFRLQ